MLISLQSVFGLAVFYLLAYVLSENRPQVKFRIILAGLASQWLLAYLMLKISWINDSFLAINQLVLALQTATEAGTAFVFGYLGGADLPYQETVAGASFILVFKALPLVIVISALTTLFMYWRILPWIIRGISYVFEKTLNVGGAIALVAAANIFVGMVEAPLFVRPYLRDLTRSELFILMCSGMATIAGTMLMLYASILAPVIDQVVVHLLVASVISVPAAISLALVLVPETGTFTSGKQLPEEPVYSSMDAITTGTQRGVALFINISAMLLVLVALVKLANLGLAWLPLVDGNPVTLERILGIVMAPLVWLMGIPWHEAQLAGSLMGVKTVLNEMLAYLQLAKLTPDQISDRSRLILTYALCGFANFGSLGIMIGGLTTLIPERRQEIIGLGIKSIVGGTLATCCTAAIVGILY